MAAKFLLVYFDYKQVDVQYIQTVHLSERSIKICVRSVI